MTPTAKAGMVKDLFACHPLKAVLREKELIPSGFKASGNDHLHAELQGRKVYGHNFKKYDVAAVN